MRIEETQPAPISPKTLLRPRNTLQYGVLALLAILTCLYQGRFTADVVHQMGSPSEEVRPPFRVLGYPPHIHTIEPEAVRAGLQVGDEILSIEGRPLTGANTFGQVLQGHRSGDSVIVEGKRNGAKRKFVVRLAEQENSTSGAADMVLGVALGILLPWLSAILGFYVAAVRPRDPLAWMVMLLLLSFSQTVLAHVEMWGAWIRVPAEIFHTLLFSLWPACMFLFGVFFPTTLEFFKKRPLLLKVILAIYLPEAVFVTVVNVGISEDLKHFARLGSILHLLQGPLLIATYSLILLGVLFLIGKSRRETRGDARRRLRLLVAGFVVSLTPVLVLLFLAFLRRKPLDLFPSYVLVSALLVLLLFPLTLAYAIVIDRAMDVRLVVRQGLQYAFAKNGVIAVRVLILLVFTLAGLDLEHRLHGNAAAIIGLVIVLGAAVLLLNLSTRRLGAWIDRRFFRDAYNAEAVLTGLSEQVRRIRSIEPLMETVCQQIASTLHVEKMAVLLKQGGWFRTAYASGFSGVPDVSFASESSVISHLRDAREASRVYFDDSDSWLYRTPGLDEEQRGRLAFLRAELLLPLLAGDELLGFISAGPKRSEEPYTSSDVRVLSSVAAQTGLALENAELTNAIASEMAQRERMAREVEIAREVQERLFPQTLPEVRGLDYAGVCRTALGVGGDYYDFLSLPDGRFGFAVGDVAGKGISAALLMASLQASLRAETAHRIDDLSVLIANLNRRVYETSTSNRYATFFYAQYTPDSRRLDFVNAGHNPPMLLRRNVDGWDSRLLDASGTVIGLLPTPHYTQSTVALLPGDYLVAFTDGISEAMNPHDEEWGEDRLLETFRSCAQAGLTATEAMQRILNSADRFAAGARQHDDMTLVVLRVRE